MDTIGKEELRRRMPAVFESLAAGPVRITSSGRPVAVLVSDEQWWKWIMESDFVPGTTEPKA